MNRGGLRRPGYTGRCTVRSINRNPAHVTARHGTNISPYGYSTKSYYDAFAPNGTIRVGVAATALSYSGSDLKMQIVEARHSIWGSPGRIR